LVSLWSQLDLQISPRNTARFSQKTHIYQLLNGDFMVIHWSFNGHLMGLNGILPVINGYFYGAIIP